MLVQYLKEYQLANLFGWTPKEIGQIDTVRLQAYSVINKVTMEKEKMETETEMKGYARR